MSADESRAVPEAEREELLARLGEAFADGHLSREEMDRHLDATLRARSRLELAPVRDALPVAAPPRGVTPGGTGGRIRRRGAWQVPAVLEVVSEYAAVDLDLTEAVFEQPSVTIDLRLKYGPERITVPRGTVVDLDGLRAEWHPPGHALPRGAGPTAGR